MLVVIFSIGSEDPCNYQYHVLPTQIHNRFSVHIIEPMCIKKTESKEPCNELTRWTCLVLPNTVSTAYGSSWSTLSSSLNASKPGPCRWPGVHFRVASVCDSIIFPCHLSWWEIMFWTFIILGGQSEGAFSLDRRFHQRWASAVANLDHQGKVSEQDWQSFWPK